MVGRRSCVSLHISPLRHLTALTRLRSQHRSFWSSTRRKPTMAPSTSIQEARELLKNANRIVALLGAGLSASSGLPTFRGSGGLWRGMLNEDIACIDVLEADPAQSWLFYSWRRHVALQVQPNSGHYALAELAKKKENFLCLTQNVDRESFFFLFVSLTATAALYEGIETLFLTFLSCLDLSVRAGHPPNNLHHLHGDLFRVICNNSSCDHEEMNFGDPICPALAPASSTEGTTPPPFFSKDVPLPIIDTKDLPQCPKCNKGILRPGVVMYGEMLNQGMLEAVETWIDKAPVDVMLVVGTSAVVSPANAYIKKVGRDRGARVVVVNPDPDSVRALRDRDFFIQGDASELLPDLVSDAIN